MNYQIRHGKYIPEVYCFIPTIFNDYRGENFEGYSETDYNKLLGSGDGNLKFVVDSYSKSYKHVLRGFHGDHENYKLVEVLHGHAHLVVIHGTDYALNETFDLNDKTRMQVLIPPGYLNAHLVMSDECLFHYKLTKGYVPQNEQLHIKWNHPDYNIQWPIKNPILSERDR